MNKTLSLILNSFGIFFLLLFFARILFPKTIEEGLVIPSQNIPVLGKVLGESWDATDNFVNSLNNSTIQMADDIESNNFTLDEEISDIVNSDNPSQEVNNIIEQSINQKIESIKDLPNDVVEKVKDQVRQEMYSQICKSYIEDSSPSATTN